MIHIKYLIIAGLVLVSSGSFAQYSVDSISIREGYTDWYDKKVGLENTVLQHGELATLTRKSPNSHAYYESSTWLNANVFYADQSFRNIAILYDIEEDELFIANNLTPSFAAFPIKLTKELVSEFEIGAARFVYINESVRWHKPGFFKAAYQGESIDLLSKVYKDLELKYGILTYDEMHQYFLKKDGEYHRLKRLSSLLKLYPEHKKEIRQFRKQLSLRDLDSPNNEAKLVSLVEFCDNLSKK